MTAAITQLTDATFDEFVASTDQAVLVDFWADWCPPCKAMNPVLAEIAAAFAEKLSVVGVDVDHNRDVTVRSGVQAMPTLVVLKNGGEVARFVGARPAGQLTRELQAVL